MSYDFQYERFANVYEFNEAINKRKNNEVMSSRHSSQKHDDWSGTETYEEAEKLLTKGWGVKVEKMKAELRKYSSQIERIRVRSKPSMAGYAPIVAASIKGVPKAMWATERTVKKVKTLHLYFQNNATAGVESDDLMKSGMTVLKLCTLLEKQGVKVKIDILPFMAKNGNSVYGCSVAVKDYKQPFNLNKMAYPIAHTALFRRQGFKWLETMEGCTNSGFAVGYGSSVEGEIVNQWRKQFKMDDEGSIFISYYDCERSKFDPEALAKSKGIDIKIKGVK